jgi:hypothetical protein
MDKAYIDFTPLLRMNKADAFFATREKETMDYRVIENNFNIDETTGLRGDKIIKLKGPKSKQLYPEPLRMIEYYDDEKDMMLTFITDNFEVSALEVARLYPNRWQIEVFFK